MSKDKARGAFVGLAVGDALGVPLEFKARDTYTHITNMSDSGGGPFNLKVGEWTDDTSMALCLADSLLETHIEGEYSLDEENLLRKFGDWWQNGLNSVTGRCFDIGNTTRTGIQTFLREGTYGKYSAWSVGNGGIMRLSPAVIDAGMSWTIACHNALRQSFTTHSHPDCLETAHALAAILWYYINKDDSEELLLRKPVIAFTNQRVKRCYNDDITGLKRSEISSSGYAVDTLEAAIWAVETSDTFEEAVLKAVNLGDDADTVGAVAGQIAGAKWGYDAIPKHWKEKLAWNDYLLEIADKLYNNGLTK
jgi:ADP-ribosyl-[dinitrogen reductase] hydrolase